MKELLMQNMDIEIEDPRWSTLDFEGLAATAVKSTLAHLGIKSEDAEISILACDDQRIGTLNAAFRDKPLPTNILSWPSEERGAIAPGGQPAKTNAGPDGLVELGDIAISYDTCVSEASAANKPVAHHITHLMIHATLHLLGYDHETAQDAALMEGLEVVILGKLGLDDPYRES